METTIESLAESYDYFLCDCDGVLWLGSSVLPGVVNTIEYLRSKNKTCFFVTNSSFKS